MSTIPARLARAATRSSTPQEARQKVIQLYRDWYRGVRVFPCVRMKPGEIDLLSQAPEIVSVYALNVTPQFVRHQIRQRFEENRHINDIRVIDHLVQKGRLEFQECMNVWKMPDHLMNMLQPKQRPQRTFMQKFLEGRDEDQVLPAATGISHPGAP